MSLVDKSKKGKGARWRLFPRSSISEQRLAVGALDLLFPGLLDQRDDALRHRHVIVIGRCLLAVLVAPVEELQGRSRIRRIDRGLLHEDEGRTGNRPGLVAGG